MPPPSVPLTAIRQPAFLYDADGRIVEANEPAASLAGRPLAGCTAAGLAHLVRLRRPDGTPVPPAELPGARALAGEVTEAPLSVTAAGGQELEILATASPIHDGDAIAGALVLWQDVTGRVRAERAEARLRALMDHNPCLVFLKDEAGRYVYLNEAYERQFVHAKDWRGKTDYDLWPRESADLFRENDREVLESGRTRQFLEDSSDLGGTRYCWLNYKFPFTDAQGGRYVGGIGIDATALVRAEEALRESEAEYRHIVEHAPTGIYEIDYAGPRFRRVNDAMCEILGYTREELLAMDPGALLDEESRERFRERVRKVLAGEPIDPSVAFRLFARDGREIWGALEVKPTFTDGIMDGALVVAHDITEGRRMEEALRESEAKYRTLFETMDEGFLLGELVRDRGGRAVDYRVLEVNPAFEAHTGIARADAVGRLRSDANPARDEQMLAAIARVVETGQPGRVEQYNEGLGRWLSVGLFPRGGDQFALLFDDITEQKRTGEALRESERRQGFLLALGDRLRDHSSVPDLTAAAAEMVGRHLGANGVVYCEIDGAGECATVRADWNDGTVPPVGGRFRMDDFGIGELYRRGGVRRTSDVTTALDEDAAGEHCALRIRASLGVPVMRGGALAAVLAVHSGRPREWTDAEAELVREAGDRIWTAVERAKADEALRESEERFRTVIENSRDGINLLDLTTGRYVLMSPSQVEMTGYTLDEINDISAAEAYELVHPDDRAISVEQQRLIASGEEPSSTVEYRWRMKSGEYRWFSDSRRLVRDAGGTPVAMVGVSRDITAQKEAEAALHEAERHLARAQEIARVGSWSWEIGPDRLFWSDETYRILGLEPGGIPSPRNEDFLAFVHPDDRERVATAVQDALVSGSYNVEFRFVQSGGDEVYAHSQAAVTFAGGCPVRMEGTVQDITDRRQADEALRETRDYLDSLIDHANAPIIVWDPAFRITRFNAAFEHMSGRAAGEVIGRDLAVLFPGESREESLAKIERTTTEQWQSVEIPILRPDGGVRIALWNSANIYDRDGTTLLATIAQGQDITERKEAEAALREYAEGLRRSNEDLERFAYVASHDLQEPLRSVVSFSQLLERRYRGQLGPDADEYIDFIVEGGQRMQGLILDLLAFSRVNTTRQQIARTDAEDVLAESLRSLDVSLREANAALTHDPLPVVMADPTQLAQVFSNLISNAVKFRRADEPLRIHVGARRLDGFWEFSVSDNGIGIEPEYFEKIFVIFQRLHTKDRYPGTGIGLAIVKRIVDRHGGRIRVESAPGEGTTFYFTLPAA